RNGLLKRLDKLLQLKFQEVVVYHLPCFKLDYKPILENEVVIKNEYLLNNQIRKKNKVGVIHYEKGKWITQLEELENYSQWDVSRDDLYKFVTSIFTQPNLVEEINETLITLI
ncbi:hypothetical protein CR513_39329, partial [Mucuna pruriens]